MDGIKAEICDFLKKCEEVKNCKFIMATTKLKDVLKSIVNSRALYELFMSLSKNYDYTKGKKHCLVKSADGIFGKGRVILPENDGERLAFIFCLLVDIDREAINFNDFLRDYFSDDGSFYSSYYAFCETVIDNLEETVRRLFVEELGDLFSQPQPEEKESMPSGKAAKLLSVISLLIAREKQFILESAIPNEDKEEAYKMLTEIYNNLKEGRFSTANSLVCGYNYYILYNNSISDSIQSLFENIDLYERTL